MGLIASLKNMVQANRRQIEIDLLGYPKRQYFSPIYYGQYKITIPLAQKYIKGQFLDLGCGDLPFKDLLKDKVTSYDSLDFFPRTKEVTYVGDIQNMSMIPEGKYDSAICLEVLEHIPDPFRAVREIYRVLGDHGMVIISVPHLSRLHEEPHDYYRYTKYGLRYLLEQAGFKVIHLEQRGTLVSFLGHQIATLVLGIVWNVPIIRHIMWFLNRWLVTELSFYLDSKLKSSDIFALGYTVVAIKQVR